MKIYLGLIFVLLLTACAQSPQPQMIEVTHIVPQNVEVTRIVPQTVVVIQSKTIIVTATPLPITQTPTITNTPAPTNTPQPTNTPTETIAPYVLTATAQAEIDAILREDHEPGIYLVDVDIAPGVWRSKPGNDDCYWSRTTKTGDIIDNFFGDGGGTIYISPTDFQVELGEGCGLWTWLSEP